MGGFVHSSPFVVGLRRYFARARKVVNSRAGFSLIEVMIAGGLITFIAVAILPSMFTLVDSSKSTGFKAACTGAVRAKLQDYLNGAADSNTWSGAAHIPTGFEYTKKRWERYGYSTCTTGTVDPGAPGYREAVLTNDVNISGKEYQTGRDATICKGRLATDCYAVMEGFKLYVMMKHYNPRTLVNNTASRDCVGGLSPQYYQFFGLGDGIEVTVTGMVRTSGDGARSTPLGKLSDVNGNTEPNPHLVCSATEIIYPPRVPFRYYLGSDGHIRNYQSSIAYYADPNVAQVQKYASESHFRSIWTPGSAGSITASTISNIQSFAVSPDNQWVYVLRPGELARYGPCYSDGTNVTVGGVATPIGGAVSVGGVGFQGVPDCPARPTLLNFTTPDNLVYTNNSLNIDSIAVDFGANLSSVSDDKVYGLLNAGASAMETGGYTTQAGLMLATLPTTPTSGKYPITWAESTNFNLPKDRPRIRGIFMTQPAPTSSTSTNTPNLFFFDNTCFTAGGTATTSQYTYCASIFSAGDTTMSQEARELPTQVEAISY